MVAVQITKVGSIEGFNRADGGWDERNVFSVVGE